MRKLIWPPLVAFVFMLLPFSLSGTASAQPSGGWGAGGPNTVVGSAEFYGCTNFENFEHAYSEQASLSSDAKFLTDLNGNDAILQFNQAYSASGELSPDGYMASYAQGLVNEYNDGQALTTSWVSGINSLCAPIQNIPGNWANWTYNAHSWEFAPNYGSEVRWNPCDTITLNGDAWVSSHVDLGTLAWELHTLTGFNVVYSPSLGSNVDYWIHGVVNIGGTISNEVGVTSDTASPTTIVHADTEIKESDSGATLLYVARHEAGLAMGLGEPEASGTQEIMQTYVSSNFDFHAGDWYGGQQIGILNNHC